MNRPNEAPPPTRCSVRDFIVEPSRIHLASFILQGYEGLALVSTLDRKLGLIRVHMAPGCEDDVLVILRSEKERLSLREPEEC